MATLVRTAGTTPRKEGTKMFVGETGDIFGSVTIGGCVDAKALGFRTIVIDGRPRFATRERFPDADEIRIGIASEIAQQIKIGPLTPVVLVAHDYKYDVPVLEKALKTDAPYIGLLGSRRRGAAILQMLRENGVDETQLQRVRVPESYSSCRVSAFDGARATCERNGTYASPSYSMKTICESRGLNPKRISTSGWPRSLSTMRLVITPWSRSTLTRITQESVKCLTRCFRRRFGRWCSITDNEPRVQTC